MKISLDKQSLFYKFFTALHFDVERDFYSIVGFISLFIGYIFIDFLFFKELQARIQNGVRIEEVGLWIIFWVMFLFILGFFIPNRSKMITGTFIKKNEQFNIAYLANENNTLLNTIVNGTVLIQNILIFLLIISWHSGLIINLLLIIIVKYNNYFSQMFHVLYVGKIKYHEFYYNTYLYFIFYLFCQGSILIGKSKKLSNIIGNIKNSQNKHWNKVCKLFVKSGQVIDTFVLKYNMIVIIPNIIMYIIWYLCYSKSNFIMINYNNLVNISIIDNFISYCKAISFLYIIIVLFGILVFDKLKYKIIYGLSTISLMNCWTLFYLEKFKNYSHITNPIILKTMPFYNKNVPNFIKTKEIVFNILISSNVLILSIILICLMFYHFIYKNRVIIIHFLKPKIPRINTYDNIAKDILKKFNKEK